MTKLRTILLLLTVWSATCAAQRLVFSHPHGFYDTPISLTVGWEDGDLPPEAQIRFTLDGSEPTAASEVISTPLSVKGNTVLRAAAFCGSERLTPVTTATYLYASDVMAQPSLPEGYPEFWGSYCQISGTAIGDYEMDPEMVNDADLAPKIQAGLTAIPTLSIVTAPDNFFSHENDEETGGIYIYPGTPVGDGTGRDWERPVSMELFGSISDGSGDADVSQLYDLTVDCGVKIHGGHSRLPEKTPKHSLRLMFKSKYGPSKLHYPVFGLHGVKKFDQLILRCAFGNTWVHWDATNRKRAQYERDMWARAIQGLMGHPNSRGLFVHLFINGLYWGMYNLAERIDDYYCSSTFGGTREQYDVIKVEEDHSSHAIIAGDGTIDAWNAMKKQVTAAATSNDAYFQLIGADDEGNIQPDNDRLLDIDNYIDFMLINQYGGNSDWDHHNWLAFRNRERANEGFRFICWDSEMIFSSRSTNVLNLNNSGAPSSFLNKLVQNPNFVHRYMDHAYRHLVANGGWLTPDRTVAVWDSLYNIIALPLYDESARWGDYRRDVHPYQSRGDLYTVDNHYLKERERIVNQYFPDRSASFLQQLKDQGWYSEVEVPQIQVNGRNDDDTAELQFGDRLTIRYTGSIYYTLDGTNPLYWLAETRALTTATSHRYTAGQNLLDDYDWGSGQPVVLRAISRVGTSWSPVVERIFTVDVSSDIVEVMPDNSHAFPTPRADRLYDLSGRPVSTSSPLPKGIYIRNGKKISVNAASQR